VYTLDGAFFTSFYATSQCDLGLMGIVYPPGPSGAVGALLKWPKTIPQGQFISPSERGVPVGDQTMSADWFYLKRRWFGGTKKVGPLAESDLLVRIDKGEITPTTMLISAKTKNRWVKMEEIGPALKQWKKGHPISEQTGPS